MFESEKNMQRTFDLSLSFLRIHGAGAVVRSLEVFFCFCFCFCFLFIWVGGFFLDWKRSATCIVIHSSPITTSGDLFKNRSRNRFASWNRYRR